MNLWQSAAPKSVLAGLALALAAAAQAFAAQAWTILPGESTLAFTAVQNGAPTEGGFGAFSGTIAFDPDDLEGSKIDIEVDMTSVTSGYDSLVDELAKDTWFASATFPKAHYVSSRIAAKDKSYEAEGTLTLRGVSAPVRLVFAFDRYGPKAGDPKTLSAVATGTATVQRTAFGVGQGEWAKTDELKDAVAVHFTIAAERPAP